jgi:transcription antitermination factor NusG
MNPNWDHSGGEGNEWYAVSTCHQHEKTVAVNLSRYGLEVFLPLYGVTRQWKDRRKNLSLPLFPGYVFWRGDIERRVQILSTPGVHSFVMFAGRAAPIPGIEIDAIRISVESRFGVKPHPFLNCGDRCRIKSGPLAGIEGILIRKKNSYRLILSATVLARSIAVEVDALRIEVLPRQRTERKRLVTETHSGISHQTGRLGMASNRNPLSNG